MTIKWLLITLTEPRGLRGALFWKSPLLVHIWRVIIITTTKIIILLLLLRPSRSGVRGDGTPVTAPLIPLTVPTRQRLGAAYSRIAGALRPWCRDRRTGPTSTETDGCRGVARPPFPGAHGALVAEDADVTQERLLDGPAPCVSVCRRRRRVMKIICNTHNIFYDVAVPALHRPVREENGRSGGRVDPGRSFLTFALPAVFTRT